MTEHVLKCLSQYFEPLERGEKNFEVRRDDRGFQKGDILVLRKFDGKFYELAEPGGFTAKEVRRRITYVLTGAQLGIEPGYVVLALEPEP